jgi:DNA polymerase-3 subunit epsilon
MREICLDTETTGLDPKDGHRIIEIACVELVNRVKTGNHFHAYINPRREVPQEAFRIHGISTEFLQDKPIFNHVVDGFLKFIGDDKLVIHNASFDLKFLNYELKILGLETIKNEVADSLLIARNKFPGSPASLDALCKRFNIDLSKRTKHGALLDTELLCDVYVELMGGLQAGFGFENLQNQINKEEAKEVVISTQKEVVKSRNFSPSNEELELHKKFILENFKENLWNY